MRWADLAGTPSRSQTIDEAAQILAAAGTLLVSAPHLVDDQLSLGLADAIQQMNWIQRRVNLLKSLLFSLETRSLLRSRSYRRCGDIVRLRHFGPVSALRFQLEGWVEEVHIPSGCFMQNAQGYRGRSPLEEHRDVIRWLERL